MSEWKRNENGINSDECAEEIKEEIMIRIVELPVHPVSGRPVTAGGGGRRDAESAIPYAPAESAESIGPMLPLTISDSGSNLVQPKIINASAVGASQPSFHPRNKSTVKVSVNNITQMTNSRFDVVW